MEFREFVFSVFLLFWGALAFSWNGWSGVISAALGACIGFLLTNWLASRLEPKIRIESFPPGTDVLVKVSEDRLYVGDKSFLFSRVSKVHNTGAGVFIHLKEENED